MSTTTQPTPSAIEKPNVNEVKIYGHSMLFYWWPIWAVGFILGLLSWMQGNIMAVVPHDTKAQTEVVKVGDDRSERTVLVLPKGAEFEERDLHLRTSKHKSYGVLFAIVLLIVIVVTSVPLRGMWSVMVIGVIVLFALIFALWGVWDRILGAFALLDIRINAGGYFFISTVLFIIWLLAFVLFDRRTYMVFAPGRVTVCLAIGDAESAFDTTGANINKAPSDLFRHWILGGGSGDLEVRTSGSNAQTFQLHNVLGVSRKLRIAQEMLSARQDKMS